MSFCLSVLIIYMLFVILIEFKTWLRYQILMRGGANPIFFFKRFVDIHSEIPINSAKVDSVAELKIKKWASMVLI